MHFRTLQIILLAALATDVTARHISKDSDGYNDLDSDQIAMLNSGAVREFLTTVSESDNRGASFQREINALNLKDGPTCYWEGTAPICKGECKPGWYEVDRNPWGDGKKCLSGTKAKCCPLESYSGEHILPAAPVPVPIHNPIHVSVPVDVSDDLDAITQAEVDFLRAVNEQCYWEGTAPFCHGECKPGWIEVDRNQYGDGKKCLSGTKAKCCPR